MDSFLLPPEILTLNEHTPFGHSLLPLFQLKAGFTNINHGSLGAPPRVVIQARRHYEDRMEECPDSWFMLQFGKQVDRVTDELKEFIGVSDSVGHLVLVPNVTFGMNSVLNSWPLNPGDKILFLSEAYIMTKLVADFQKQKQNIQVVEIPIRCPISDETLIELVDQSLNLHGSSVKLAIFSHISASPAFILPVSQLITLCRSRGIPCLIDGAHALGQIDINLTELDPDFYLGNGHKWFMTAKGAGFLYVKKQWRNLIHPVTITYGYGLADIRREFRYQGVSDYTSYFTFSTAMKFRRLLGEERIRKYCHNLCIQGGKAMAEIWGTDLLIDEESKLGSMCNVRLPLPHPRPTNPDQFLKQLVKELFLHHNTYMLVNYCQDGKWYTRISAQIYNEIDDFRMAAKAFLAVSDQMRAEKYPDGCWDNGPDNQQGAVH